MRERTTAECRCQGKGRTFDIEWRPVQCGPCTVDRTEAALQTLGWVPECKSCTAVLTVEEYRALGTAPAAVKSYGILCAECAESMTRGNAA